MILRTGAPDEVHAGMELEAGVQRAAARAGAPVPHVLVADDSVAALGDPFLICDFIDGQTIVRRIQRTLDDAGRERLLTQCAQALAAIHRAEPPALPASTSMTMRSPRSWSSTLAVRPSTLTMPPAIA
mgnify:CR=1 FL=1